MSNTITTTVPDLPALLDDLSTLNAEQRSAYYLNVCRSLGLNPLTQPFRYIRLSNRLVLYATKQATDQLARIHAITTEILSAEFVNVESHRFYRVICRARMASHATDATGIVAISPTASADEIANLTMKAETKAKRRAILSLVGLSTDADETMPFAQETNETTPPALSAQSAAYVHPLIFRARAKVANFRYAPRPAEDDIKQVWTILDEFTHGRAPEAISLLFDRDIAQISDLRDDEAAWLVTFARLNSDAHNEALAAFRDYALYIAARPPVGD